MPSLSFVAPLLLAAMTAISGVYAETHTITFDNRCGKGTPKLKQNFQTLSTGGAYTHNGPFTAAIAYLDTGNCGDSGENCVIVETSLINGGISSTDLSLIPPHAFQATTGFGYYHGCDGAGADCTNGNCNTAFHKTDDYQVQVQCTASDVNLAITFCA
ncbi:unnamed protein product [Peniophora sp. CBMAI 1063]|nr:unnamed protein product [Peniophora sp. CBMAI 1063]